MSWSVGDEISASNLNSNNQSVTSYTYSHSDRGTSSTCSYKFYLHDCGGTNNPTIIDWYIHTTTSWYWFNNYGPDIKAYIQKLNSSGRVIGTYSICDYENKTVTYDGSLSRTAIISHFGSFEGWYRIYSYYERDDRGTGTVQWKVYGYPSNSKSGLPIRRYISPTSSGYVSNNSSEQLLSASNLNSHMFGTY